ncbi:MAG: hypothetical protein K9J17_06040 [Flavobacteriales bacterium]|nr:hypothetical protein [Flavobacteriales bacterium]
MVAASHVRFLVFLPLLFALASCEDNQLVVVEKPVTSMFLTLTPDSGQVVVLSCLDNDGPSGNPPYVNNVRIRANTVYRGQLILGNQIPISSAKLEHIIDSTSVEALPETHQIFFTVSNELNLHVAYDDADANGFPVGMNTIFSSESTSKGELKIRIVHEPNKSAIGAAAGIDVRVGGKTDAEATFQIEVID